MKSKLHLKMLNFGVLTPNSLLVLGLEYNEGVLTW